MMRVRHHLLGLCLVGACQNPNAGGKTFFDQRINPIVEENCVNGTANNLCHSESTQAPGTALGNLDMSSFEAIHRRPDLLEAYGSYPEPVMLLKAVKPSEVTLQYAGTAFESEIFHAGGGILSRDSEAFIELQQWLRDGATIDGVRRPDVAQEGSGACATALRPEVQPFLALATGPQYDTYRSVVEPVLQARCAFGSCHGSSQSDLYLTCGANDEQIQHNFVVAKSFVSMTADRSELLLRPLSANKGGVNHSGGDIWDDTSDSEYAGIRQWAIEAGPLDPGNETPEFAYFTDQVMPVLLKRGCAMPQCHSPQGFNDFRLRAGSRGFFSPLALRRNYEATLNEFVNLDTPDPNQSRIIKKNLPVDNGGIAHRAGLTLLDIFGADDSGNPDLCPPDQDDQPTSYCTLVEWLRRERSAALAANAVTTLDEGDTVPAIYVDRPADSDRILDFATYRGGARLMRVDLTVGIRGALGTPGAPTEIDLSGCGAGADIDVRRPDVSFEGDRMVFALRGGASDGLNVYESDLDGQGCTQLTSDGGGSDNGVAIHNFDPAYVPPDADSNPGGAIAFASTRPGRSGSANVSPRYKLPASNIWRMQRDGSGVEQMTVLNGSELFPAMMHNGQLTMTTEKATSSFYQLAGRRINWDLTDYHPLLGQRETIGYGQATFIREGLDRNFVLILSNPEANFAGGSLVTFNRSIGPFEFDREGEPGYVPAVRHLDPAAREAGRGPAVGAYRSPFAAPDGSFLVSYAGGNLDLTDAGAPVDYDLVLFDPVTGARTVVADGAGFQVDGVIAYRRGLRHVFVNIPELVFGGKFIPDALSADEAWAHFPDLPMLATLLTNNRRGARGLGDLASGDTIAVYRADPPPGGAADGSTFESWSLMGTRRLEEDGSVFVRVPAGIPVILELRQGDTPILTMTEEHQFGAGELTSLGVHRDFFDGVCGGCHGSIEGEELDVVVNPDALTGASTSLARPDPQSTPAGL